MQIRRFSLVLCLFLTFSLSAEVFAQRIITGKVLNLNSKLPVENVAVTVFKGTKFTTTNDNGYFQLTLEHEDSLVFTHPEYKSGGLKLPEADVFVIYIEQYNYYPVYQEGEFELYDYLSANLKFPRKARFRSIEGVLFVELLIDSDGKMIGCSTLNEIGANSEDDIIEVFSKIPGIWSKSDASLNKRLIFPIKLQLGFDDSDIAIPDIQLPEGKLMRTITITAIEGGQMVR